MGHSGSPGWWAFRATRGPSSRTVVSGSVVVAVVVEVVVVEEEVVVVAVVVVIVEALEVVFSFVIRLSKPTSTDTCRYLQILDECCLVHAGRLVPGLSYSDLGQEFKAGP